MISASVYSCDVRGPRGKKNPKRSVTDVRYKVMSQDPSDVYHQEDIYVCPYEDSGIRCYDIDDLIVRTLGFAQVISVYDCII